MCTYWSASQFRHPTYAANYALFNTTYVFVKTFLLSEGDANVSINLYNLKLYIVQVTYSYKSWEYFLKTKLAGCVCWTTVEDDSKPSTCTVHMSHVGQANSWEMYLVGPHIYLVPVLPYSRTWIFIWWLLNKKVKYYKYVFAVSYLGNFHPMLKITSATEWKLPKFWLQKIWS